MSPADSLFALGLSFYLQGFPDSALLCYRQAEAIESSPGLFFAMAIAYEDLGQLEQAAGAYRKLLRVKPGDKRAWFNLALVYEEMGLVDSARTAYKTALLLDPDYAKAAYNLAINYQESGLADSAIKYYKVALAARGDFPEAWYRLAALLARRGQKEEAIEALGRAIRLRPSYKALARDDYAFQNLRGDPRFQAIVQ